MLCVSNVDLMECECYIDQMGHFWSKRKLLKGCGWRHWVMGIVVTRCMLKMFLGWILNKIRTFKIFNVNQILMKFLNFTKTDPNFPQNPLLNSLKIFPFILFPFILNNSTYTLVVFALLLRIPQRNFYRI